MLRHATGTAVRGAFACFALAALTMTPFPSGAETAWVKDELRLNLRTGAGTEFRIIGVIKSGDRVEVLERKEGWTQVQRRGDEAGWIPVGYLQVAVPARIQLVETEERLTSLQEELDQLTTETELLRTSNQNLDERDVERTAAVEKLTRENQAYQAAADWGGYITGAVILGVGMIVGWILKVSSGRGRSSRVRL